jgi:small conductance mechanosensitive channel
VLRSALGPPRRDFATDKVPIVTDPSHFLAHWMAMASPLDAVPVHAVNPSALTLSRPMIVVLLFVAGLLLTRVTRVLLRRIVSHVADRSLVKPSRWWRTRDRRSTDESAELYEQRRRQRVDAAAHMLHHLFALVLWIVLVIAAFQILDIDAAFFLSSAGFLGAAVAIGGQHKVNDYLTGLSVLIEDRYGVGDEVIAPVPNWPEPAHGIVEHIGLVSTRLRDARGTVHLPHSSLNGVRNLSQEPAGARLSVILPDGVHADDLPQVVADTMRDLAGSKNLTQVLFVDDIKAAATDSHCVQLDVRTSRPLQPDERDLLVRRTQERLSSSD